MENTAPLCPVAVKCLVPALRRPQLHCCGATSRGRRTRTRRAPTHRRNPRPAPGAGSAPWKSLPLVLAAIQIRGARLPDAVLVFSGTEAPPKPWTFQSYFALKDFPKPGKSHPLLVWTGTIASRRGKFRLIRDRSKLQLLTANGNWRNVPLTVKQEATT